MSLEVFTCSDEKLRQHITTCNVRLCQICRDICERWAVEAHAMVRDAWEAEYRADEKLRKAEGR